MLNEMLKGKRLGRYVPIIGWVTTYQHAWLRDDLVSGVVVGAIMIPVAMAYAQMAGVPPQAGLYAAIVGMTAYALFATSRHLKITTSDLRRSNIDLLLAQVRGSVRRRMRGTGSLDHIGEDHVFASVDAAVRDFELRHQ